MLRIHRLGRQSYSITLPQQVQLKDAVRKNRPQSDDYLILVEHEPVITLGRSWTGGNLLLPMEKYGQLGIEVHKASRGGDVTYHGPGQLVAYPVFDLTRYGKDIHKFLWKLEEVAIRTLSDFGLHAGRKKGMTGAWANGTSKVCAIGVAISGWVSYHGLAFNIEPDLKHFGLIIPCGISNYSVASLATLLEKAPEMQVIEDKFTHYFPEIFGIEEVRVTDDSKSGRLSCLDEEGHLKY